LAAAVTVYTLQSKSKSLIDSQGPDCCMNKWNLWFARGDLHQRSNGSDTINEIKDETKRTLSEYAAYVVFNVFFSVTHVNWHWWRYFFHKSWKNIKDEVLFYLPPLIIISKIIYICLHFNFENTEQ
jgi:hypothetical protein